MDFSKEQRAAITAQNRELLVSAAAGSGKTAVLIEKIYTMLKAEGLSVNRMLVVTFTRAAAAEMRERLKRRMAGDPSIELRKQREQLELAQISTLHSFCHKLVQEYFQAADVDPLSAIADTTVSANLFQEALDAAMDALYATAASRRRGGRRAHREVRGQANCYHGDGIVYIPDDARRSLRLAQGAGGQALHPGRSGNGRNGGDAACRLPRDIGWRKGAFRTHCPRWPAHPACHPKYIPVIHADIEAAKALERSARHGLLAAVTAAQAFALDRMPRPAQAFGRGKGHKPRIQALARSTEIPCWQGRLAAAASVRRHHRTAQHHAARLTGTVRPVRFPARRIHAA